MNFSSVIHLQRSILIFLLIIITPSLLADYLTECPEGVAVQTTNDPQIPMDELEIRLKPMTRCELAEETKGWMGILKAKAQEISDEELVSKYKKSEHKQAEEAFEAIEDAKEALEDLPSSDQTESTEATLADQQEKEAVLSEAQKQIDEAMEAQEKSAELMETDITKEVLTKVEPAVDDDQSTGEEALKDEETATKQLDKVEVGELQDQEKLNQVADAAAQLADSKAEIRQSLLEHITLLQSERTALIDRTNLVIDAFEEKGGAEETIGEYRQYIKAISGLKVDVSDVDATSTAIIGWLLSKEGGLRWGKNIAIFIVTVLAFYFLSIIVGRTAERTLIASKHTSALLSDFLAKAIRRGIIALGVLAGLAALEVNIGPLLAVIGALGFVVAFALQNSLGNFASGILILLYRPFDVGDLIEVSGVLGKVSSMNLLSTHIKTLDNKSVIVPNNSIWGDVITNATGTNKRRVDMMFGIGYEDDIDKAQKIMEDILTSHDLVLKDPEPVVRLHELGDSSLNFVCRPWTRTDNYWNVYWDVTKAVKERFDADEISIPFPQRDVHLFSDQPVKIDKGSS
ncbi:MAG: mechanosensitive ion channel domain-containing protein [Pseudomonadota bacterium]